MLYCEQVRPEGLCEYNTTKHLKHWQSTPKLLQRQGHFFLEYTEDDEWEDGSEFQPQ